MTTTKRINPINSVLSSRGIRAALLAMVLVGMAVGLTPAEAEEAASEPEPQFLVSNLGVGVAGSGGIQRALNAGRSGFAQAFTTGTKTDGYALGSLGIQVSHFYDASTVGDHLQVTINAVASGGGPGDALCTLTNPSSFSTPGVSAFEAAAGAGSCPQLATETTYFVVIEWVDPSGTGSFALIPQTYPTEESDASEEDPGGAEGWSIADQSYYLNVSSNARTWTAFVYAASFDAASFKIVVKEAAVTVAQATGAPTISGTAQVGQTLRADTSGIADEDGLSNATFTYQWIRSDGSADTDIAGATGDSYQLTDADEGKTIKVKVTFADDADNEESRTSEPTAAVTAPPLTASLHSVPASHDGSTVFTFELHFSEEFKLSYLVLRDQAFTVTGGTVSRATRVDKGFNIKREIHVQPDGDGAICTVDGRKLSTRLELTVSGPGGAPTTTDEPAPNTSATGQPTISGTVQVGETLMVDTSGIADEDGLTNPGFTYQWMADDTNIQGATASTYTLTEDDEGKTITVTVTFTDAEGNPETLTSDPTGEVAAKPNIQATGLPTISGMAQVGETLTADTSEIADEDGLPQDVFSYRWLADDVAIAGASGSSYTLTKAEQGKTVTVTVTFTDNADHQESLTSDPTGAVEAAPNNHTTGAPTITGTAQVGEPLTASTAAIIDADGLTQAEFSYQWLADEVEIQDESGSGYTLATEDEGKTITVTVTFTDDAGYQETRTSDPTGAVAAAANSQATGVPTIAGTAQVGETLTVDTAGIADEDGLDNVTFSYQWLADDANILGATNRTYTLAEEDEGKTIKVIVSFTDDANNEESLPSAATDAVAAQTVPGRPLDLVGEATAQEIKLTWSAPAGDAVVEYVIYRAELENGQLHGRPMTKYATIDAAGKAMTYTDDNVEEGVEYRYRVAAVNATGEGKKSNWLDITAEEPSP